MKQAMVRGKTMRQYFGLMLAAWVIAACSQAATITFSDRSVVTNDASGSALLTNGSYVVAGNVYGGLPNPVVNGVAFQQLSFGTSATDSGVTLSVYDLGGTGGQTFSDAQTYYSASTELAGLMAKNYQGAYYANGIGITVSNLTVGVEYQLQGFYWDKASGSIQYIRNASDTDNRSASFLTSASAVGYSWTATWVADSTAQSIEVKPGQSSRALLAGVSLRAMGVPEFGTPISVPDDSGSVFMNSGVYAIGVNVGNAVIETNTVNGVSFLSGGVDGTTQIRSANGVTATITTDAGLMDSQAVGVYTDTASPDEVFDILNTGYMSNNSDTRTVSIEFSGLTSNRTYRLQTFHMISSGGLYRRMQYQVDGLFESDNFTAFYDGASFTSAVANTVTFTADAATATIDLVALPSHRAYLSGFSLYHFDVPVDPYDSWTFQYPGIGSATNWNDNPDNDGLDNLSEWALGGNPDDGDDIGLVPVFEPMSDGGTNYFQYVHAQRSDASILGLSYHIEWSDDLASTPWTNENYEIVGTNVTGEAFDYVTNRVSTAAAGPQFLKLVIEAN